MVGSMNIMTDAVTKITAFLFDDGSARIFRNGKNSYVVDDFMKVYKELLRDGFKEVEA